MVLMCGLGWPLLHLLPVPGSLVLTWNLATLTFLEFEADLEVF